MSTPKRRRGPATNRAISKQRSGKAATTAGKGTDPLGDPTRPGVDVALARLQGVTGSGPHWNAICPVHNDSDPSLCIDVKRNTWGNIAVYFRCPVCNANGDAVLAALDLSDQAQVIYHRENARHLTKPPPPSAPLPTPEQIQRHVDYLFSHPDLLAYVTEVRGVSAAVVRDVALGYHEGLGQYWMPIYDADGAIVNVRRYNPNVKPKMRHLPGHGSPARLYPCPPASDARSVVVTEGEWDALVARSHGLTAVSGTHGALTWRPEWAAHFAGKRVAVVYDCDDAGREGAAKIVTALAGTARSVCAVDLGLDDGDDLSDWFNKHGRSVDELRDLLNRASRIAGGAYGGRRRG